MALIHGIGVDIAYIPRFASTITRFGERFLRRAFHPSEIERFYSLSSMTREQCLKAPATAQLEFVASRWAVKEATIKAIGKRLLFPELALYSPRHTSGESFSPSTDPRPKLLFHGRAEQMLRELGLNHEGVHVSVSHDRDYTVAYVLLQKALFK